MVKSIAKDFVNCVVSYMLSQPVEIDLMILVVLILEYVGVMRLGVTLKLVRSTLVLMLYELKQFSNQRMVTAFSPRSNE